MSLPELPPLPPIPEGQKEPRGFTGAKLISREDLESAVATDDYINKVKTYIQEDKAYILTLQKDIAVAMKPLYKLRRMIARMRERIANRERQKTFLIKKLRIRLAYEKIQKIRKEIGIH